MCLGWNSYVKGGGLRVYSCMVLCKSMHRSSLFYFCLFVLHVHFAHLLWSSFK